MLFAIMVRKKITQYFDTMLTPTQKNSLTELELIIIFRQIYILFLQALLYFFLLMGRLIERLFRGFFIYPLFTFTPQDNFLEQFKIIFLTILSVQLLNSCTEKSNRLKYPDSYSKVFCAQYYGSGAGSPVCLAPKGLCTIYPHYKIMNLFHRP